VLGNFSIDQAITKHGNSQIVHKFGAYSQNPR